jgi:PleD family two-component response regulator
MWSSPDRLRSQIASLQFVLRGTLATQITVSIGVAQAATDLDDALEKASRCLARAKERGPDVVESLPG